MPPPRGVVATLAPYLSSAAATFAREAGVPAVAVGAIVADEPPYAFGDGTIDVEAGEAGPPGGHTAFRVGSLTKPFTAAAVLRLAASSALALEDPVVRHLPPFAAVQGARGASAYDVTVGDLVAHRGGLPGEVRALDESSGVYPTADEVVDGLAEITLLHAPGTATRYSNLGYQLLGEIVARVSGAPFEEYCRAAVFAPLGLVGSSFRRPDGAARGHHARAFTDRVRPAPDRRKRTMADGGLWSTVQDQLRWISAQVSDPAWRVMHGPLPGSDADGAAGQGLGWFRERLGARVVLYHQGSTPGFSARLAFSPEHRAGVVALANGETSMQPLVAALADLVFDGVDGSFPRHAAPEVPPRPRPSELPAAWEPLLGFYVWPGSAMLFRLEERAGALRLVDLEGAGPVTLQPEGTDTFVALDGGWAGERVRVLRHDDGRVRGLRLGAWTIVRLVEA